MKKKILILLLLISFIPAQLNLKTFAKPSSQFPSTNSPPSLPLPPPQLSHNEEIVEACFNCVALNNTLDDNSDDITALERCNHKNCVNRCLFNCSDPGEACAFEDANGISICEPVCDAIFRMSGCSPLTINK